MAVQTPVKAKYLRIKVVDTAKESGPAVNIKMPVGLVRWGMKVGKAFSPEMRNADVDWDALSEMIEQGEIGELVEVEDQTERKHIEIWVE